jgi:polyphosphate kinase 2 (PPK2 family)
VVVQAVNAGGKDGTIAEITTALDPTTPIRIERFTRPSTPPPMPELRARALARGPGPGELVVFHRSYYEELLRAVLEGDPTADTIAADITELEHEYTRCATTLVKVMLHIDRDEQLRRLDHRRDDHGLRHLHNPDDYRDQRTWDDLMRAYQAMLVHTHTASHPWFVIPANDRELRNALVAGLLHPHLTEPGSGQV